MFVDICRFLYGFYQNKRHLKEALKTFVSVKLQSVTILLKSLKNDPLVTSKCCRNGDCIEASRSSGLHVFLAGAVLKGIGKFSGSKDPNCRPTNLI